MGGGSVGVKKREKISENQNTCEKRWAGKHTKDQKVHRWVQTKNRSMNRAKKKAKEQEGVKKRYVRVWGSENQNEGTDKMLVSCEEGPLL